MPLVEYDGPDRTVQVGPHRLDLSAGTIDVPHVAVPLLVRLGAQVTDHDPDDGDDPSDTSTDDTQE